MHQCHDVLRQHRLGSLLAGGQRVQALGVVLHCFGGLHHLRPTERDRSGRQLQDDRGQPQRQLVSTPLLTAAALRRENSRGKENIEEEAVNKTSEPLVVRDEIDHEVDQLVVTTVGDGLKAKDEGVSSSVVELGTGEDEPTSVIGELCESAEVVPVAAEIVHADNPSSADAESGTTARNEKPSFSTSEQAQSSTTSEGVGASLAVENVSITGIGESAPVSVDDKADVATIEQPHKQAATSTSNEGLASTSDEPAVGLPPGTNVTLEDGEAREETANAAEREDGGGHTLPNADMEVGGHPNTPFGSCSMLVSPECSR